MSLCAYEDNTNIFLLLMNKMRLLKKSTCVVKLIEQESHSILLQFVKTIILSTLTSLYVFNHRKNRMFYDK
jgi:hypothetical protein